MFEVKTNEAIMCVYNNKESVKMLVKTCRKSIWLRQTRTLKKFKKKCTNGQTPILTYLYKNALKSRTEGKRMVNCGVKKFN